MWILILFVWLVLISQKNLFCMSFILHLTLSFLFHFPILTCALPPPISSPALNSPLVLVHDVDSELSLSPVAPMPSCLHILPALMHSWFPFRKNRFQEQLSHTMTSEDGPAGSKKTLPRCCLSRLEFACYRQSFVYSKNVKSNKFLSNICEYM